MRLGKVHHQTVKLWNWRDSKLESTKLLVGQIRRKTTVIFLDD